MRFDRHKPRAGAAVVARGVDALITAAARGRRMVRGYATVGRFAARGDHFEFDPEGTYSYGSISVGDHVNLGARPTILATRARVTIGSHVMFGPGVTIRGGNHRTDLPGLYMDEVDDSMKRPEDDQGVVIEDDVWVGGNATILHGVSVGRGSVVAASAVVVKDVPPYSVVAGNPAKVVSRRWPGSDDAAHEAQLATR